MVCFELIVGHLNNPPEYQALNLI